MKLKNIKSFVIGLIVASMAVIQMGCEQDWQKDLEPSVLAGANTATVSVSAVKDSTATVGYTLSTVGRIYIAVVPGTNETVAPDAQDLLKLGVGSAVYAKQIIMDKADALTGSVSVSGLTQNTSYKVFVLPVNNDGVLGAIATTDAFTTSDMYEPVLDLDAGISPAISSSAKQADDFSIKLTFDEPVMLAADFDIQIGYLDAVASTDPLKWIAVAKDSISISSNVVTIKHMQTLLNGQYVFLTIAEGAITDRSANEYAGVTSGIIGGKLAGIYWRVATEAKTETDILPTDEEYITDAAAFDVIKLVYPYELDGLNGDYESSMIKVRYYTSELTEDYNISASDLDMDGDTLFIYLPKTADYGSNVSISIAEDAVFDVYGNGNAEIEMGDYDWFISYGFTRDMFVGEYSVACTGYAPLSIPNATYNPVTITEDPDLDNGIIINGFLDTDSSIYATVDGDLATITISTSDDEGYYNVFLGDLLGDGGEAVLASGAGGDLTGTLGADGSMSIDWVSVRIFYESSNVWHKVYTSTIWTKNASKKQSAQARKPEANLFNADQNYKVR